MGGTFSSTGSLSMLAPGGMVTDGRPLNASGRLEPAAIFDVLVAECDAGGADGQWGSAEFIAENHAHAAAADADVYDLAQGLIVEA